MKIVLGLLVGVGVLTAAAYTGLLLWYDGERIQTVTRERMLSRHGIVLQVDTLERSFEVRPLIQLGGLRVANAENREHPLVEISNATLRVHPLSFLIGPATIDDILIEDLRITIPASDGGALYWDPLVATASQWIDRFDWSLPRFEIHGLRVEARNIDNDNDFLVSTRHITGRMERQADLTILVSELSADLDTALPLQLRGHAQLEKLELSRQEGDLPVVLAASGRVGDRKLSLDAEGENLLEGDPMERDRIQARIALGDATATIDGTISREDLKHLDLLVDFNKPGDADEPPVDIKFNISDPGLHWQFSEIRAEHGESLLTGEAELSSSNGRRFFGGRFALADVRYPLEGEEEDSSETTSKILPEGDLYANLLRFSKKFDADVRIDAQDSTVFGVHYGKVAFQFWLEEGKLAAEVLHALIEDTELTAALRITPTGNQTTFEFDASLFDAPLSALLGGFDTLDGVTGEFDGKVRLQSSGESSSAVLETTSGEVVLALRDGAMPERLATRVAGDLFGMAFDDTDASDEIPIHCAVVAFQAQDGVAQAQRIIMDTSSFILRGKGEIRLGEQSLDIKLKPEPRDFSLVSMQTPMRISGPFKDIEFDTDLSEGVASLLTPIKLGEDDDPTCGPPLAAANP